MDFDVVVIGGGPAGLQAALTLGRGQRRTLLVDAGPPRNARATEVHNFLTRDGTPPATIRALAHQELAAYDVAVRKVRALTVDGPAGDLRVGLEDGEVRARRVLLATGMVDVLPDLPGLADLWGHTVFQCPYCHGHEVRGQRWAVWAAAPEMLQMAAFARGWTDDVVALTAGAFPVDQDLRGRLAAAGVPLDERPIAGLTPAEQAPDRLGAVVFADGPALPRDALMYHPPQRQVPLVQALGLALDPAGFVVVDGEYRTSHPGIYAAGDLATRMQAAIAGAAAGMAAAAMLNRELTLEIAGWSAR